MASFWEKPFGDRGENDFLNNPLGNLSGGSNSMFNKPFGTSDYANLIGGAVIGGLLGGPMGALMGAGMGMNFDNQDRMREQQEAEDAQKKAMVKFQTEAESAAQKQQDQLAQSRARKARVRAGGMFEGGGSSILASGNQAAVTGRGQPISSAGTF